VAVAAGHRFGPLPVRAISLMRSDLSPRGARHRELESIALRPRAPAGSPVGAERKWPPATAVC
jgi:hypothetical protein